MPCLGSLSSGSLILKQIKYNIANIILKPSVFKKKCYLGVSFLAFHYLLDHNYLLYLPTQMHILIGGEHVTCCWSKLTNSLGQTKLTNSLGKQQLELSTNTWSGYALWNCGKSVCSHCQANNFLAVFFHFRVGRYNKTLNYQPRGKQWVLFPLNLNVLLSFALGNTEGLRGKKKRTVSLGTSH